MGAWIEISGADYNNPLGKVAPVWGRGLKFAFPDAKGVQHLVAPVWGRGLKY